MEKYYKIRNSFWINDEDIIFRWHFVIKCMRGNNFLEKDLHTQVSHFFLNNKFMIWYLWVIYPLFTFMSGSICFWTKTGVYKWSSALCVSKLTSKCAVVWWSPLSVWASSALPWPWWEWSAQRSGDRKARKPDWQPCQASTSCSAVNSLCIFPFTLAVIKACGFRPSVSNSGLEVKLVLQCRYIWPTRRH